MAKIISTLWKVATIGAVVLPAASRITQKSNNEDKINDLGEDYTGYSMRYKNFKIERMMSGYGPLIGVTLAKVGVTFVRGLIKELKA